jgi:hypothetical protein
MLHLLRYVLALLFGHDVEDFVQYTMLVDKYAHRPKKKAVYEPHVFYGQLQHIYRVHFRVAHKNFKLKVGTEAIMVEIKNCKVDASVGIKALDTIKYYQGPLGATHCVDVTSIDGLVGRVNLGGESWAIIDRLNADASQRTFDYEEFDEDEGEDDLPPRVMSL